MATKVDIISRCVERLLPLAKERPGLRGQVLQAQKWCGETTREVFTSDDAAVMLMPFLTGVHDPKDEAIVTTSLDALDKLMSYGIVNQSMRVITRVGGSSSAAPQTTSASQATMAENSDTAAAADHPGQDEEGVSALEAIVTASASRVAAQSEDILIHVIRTLLTAVAANDASGAILYRSVDTLTAILMSTRGSKHTQQTGKAALSQIAGIVQRRTEVAFPTSPAAAAAAGSEEEQEPEAWIDFLALLRRFTKLIDTTDVPRISLGLTLLHNTMLTLTPTDVVRSQPVMDHIRSRLTACLVPLMVSTTPTVSKAAFYLVQHLLETFHSLLNRELGPILNFVYAIAERSSNYAIRSSAYTTLVSLAKCPELLASLYRNYDCADGRPYAFAQFCEKISGLVQGATSQSASGVVPDEVLRVYAVSAVNSVAQSIKRFYNVRQTAAGLSSAQGDDDLATSPSSTDRSFSRASFADVAAASSTNLPPANADELSFSELVRQIDGKRRATSVLKGFFDDPKAGIEAAIDIGLIENSEPEEIARFLRTRGIDKVKVGEYLAKNKPDIKAIEEAFICMNDFSNMPIDEAIRLLMGFYKIAGEAQVVDRAMQVFSKRYCDQNPGAFADADTAYVLSFAIMMLNTDQHSPNVREKMTVENFIANNRGIDNGNDLDRDLLSSIFKRIHEREIRLNDDSITLEDDETIKASSVNPNATKKEVLLWDPQPCVEKTVERLAACASFEPMKVAMDPQFAVLLYNIAWPYAYSALQRPFGETVNATKLVLKSIDGAERYVLVAAHLGNAAGRRTFVTLLKEAARVTERGVDLVGVKHALCVEALIRLATNVGNELDDSWADVLSCISRSTRIAGHLRALAEKKEGKLSKGEAHCLESLNKHLCVDVIDAMFASAVRLSDPALLALVDGLLGTALTEFAESPPRVSAFIQLMEVFGGCQHRKHSVLDALWRTLAGTAADIAARMPKVAQQVFRIITKFFEGVIRDHKESAAQQENNNPASSPVEAIEPLDEASPVASPNVDGADEELAAAAPAASFWQVWQRSAMDVLWRSAWQSRDSAVRGHILSTLTVVITNAAPLITHGWEPMVRLLGLLARDADSGLVTRAYFTYLACLPHVARWDKATLVAGVSTATNFASSGDPDISTGAADMLDAFAAVARFGPPRDTDSVPLQHLNDSCFSDFVASMAAAHEDEDFDGESLETWGTIVGSIGSLITSPSTPIRWRSVEGVFRVLRTYPEVWSRSADGAEWTVVVAGGVLPMIDSLLFQLENTSTSEASAEPVAVLQRAIEELTALVGTHDGPLRSLHTDVINLMSRCLKHRQGAVSDVAVGLLREWASAARGAESGFAAALGDAAWAHACELVSSAVEGVAQPVQHRPASAIVRAQQALDILALAAASNSRLLDAYQRHTLPALERAFVASGSPTAARDAKTAKVLVDFSSRCAMTAVRIVNVRADVASLHRWSRRAIVEYSAAVDRARGSAGEPGHATWRAASLTDAVGALLNSQLSQSPQDVEHFVGELTVELCDLIRCCEPRIAAPLSALFKQRLVPNARRSPAASATPCAPLRVQRAPIDPPAIVAQPAPSLAEPQPRNAKTTEPDGDEKATPAAAPVPSSVPNREEETDDTTTAAPAAQDYAAHHERTPERVVADDGDSDAPSADAATVEAVEEEERRSNKSPDGNDDGDDAPEAAAVVAKEEDEDERPTAPTTSDEPAVVADDDAAPAADHVEETPTATEDVHAHEDEHHTPEHASGNSTGKKHRRRGKKGGH